MESDSILAGSSPEFARNDIGSQLCTASVCCDTFMEQGSYLGENGYETPSSPPCLLPHQTLDQNCCSPSSCTPPVLHQQPSPPSSEDSIGCSSPPEGIVSQSTGGSVARRNERERKRVRMVNMGFAKLRQYVPTAARGKRLSKVETLRSAIDYIRQLKQLLLYHQHYVEDNGADYYRHLYEPQPKMGAMPFHFVPRHRNFFCDGGLPAAYAAESSGETGCAATWSVGNDSPCFDSELPPGCGAIMDGESQMACWAM